MRILRFCCQEVLRGTLHAFDLAGKHGLLPDLREDKKVRIGHGEDGPVQSAPGRNQPQTAALAPDWPNPPAAAAPG
jgi:hypothetical protein